VLKVIKKEPLFIIFFIIFLFIFRPNNFSTYIKYINFDVILTLTSILLITTSIKSSHFLEYYLEKIIIFANTKRKFAFLITIFTIFISMFVTNDISLFITIPIILSLKEHIKDKLFIAKLIIFQAFGANSGSMLTPIGNPQNIYLFHHFHQSFFHFIKIMSFPFFITFFILMIMIFLSFKNEKIELSVKKIDYNKKLFLSSILLLLIFLVFFKINILAITFITFIATLVINPKAFKEFDYFLILTFIFMFIDIKYLINHYNIHITLNSNQKIYLFSIFLSQIISNVPASIVTAHLFNNFKAIAWGVNIGGNGIIISSFANVIALRLFKYKRINILFHKYSIIFLLITALICYFLI